MKTLSQIEARTPLSVATTISQSGSYYLTTNITVNSGNGITISADNVSLDLNGFTISSTAPSATGYGIYLSDQRNITIINGSVAGGVVNNEGTFSGSGFDSGIYGLDAHNVTISGVSIAGCLNYGIYLSEDTTVVDACTVRTVGLYGIKAGTITASVVEDCGGTAIHGDQISDCRGESVGSYGINGTTVNNSYGVSYSQTALTYGIYASWAVNNSYGYGYSKASYGYGIYASTVNNSYGYGKSSVNFAYGILASAVNNSYGYGHSSTSVARGISATTVNSCSGTSYVYGTSDGCGIYATDILNSYGSSTGDSGGDGFGIEADTISNCKGYSGRSTTASRGILANQSVENSYGACAAGTGIEAKTAHNCNGSGVSGISGTVVSGCHGTGTTDVGIAGTVVHNSYGISTSTYGIFATLVQNCYGRTTSGSYGLHANRSAIGSFGSNGGGGIGIYGNILNSCSGYSASGTAVSSSNKYNMP
jgi:hypothetical protein